MIGFKFSCPRYNRHIQCDERFFGNQIQCPARNRLSRIPPSPARRADFPVDDERFMPIVLVYAQFVLAARSTITNNETKTHNQNKS